MLFIILKPCSIFFFFFNDTATTEIYTLSLHDALPISDPRPALFGAASARLRRLPLASARPVLVRRGRAPRRRRHRSEEHTSELQSPCNLVCRLLLEKKKKCFNPQMWNLQETKSYNPSQ